LSVNAVTGSGAAHGHMDAATAQVREGWGGGQGGRG
jgi:hypothetical protein